MKTIAAKTFTLTALLSTIVGLAPVASASTTYATDFEGFALGGDTSGANPLIEDPALATNDWRGNGASGLADNGVLGSQYDGEIVDTGSPHGLAYRLSNAKVSGNYDTTHAATPTVDLVGESTTTATFGTFKFGFDFRAAVDALQDGLSIDVTPFTSNSSNRQGIVRLFDNAADGFSLGWWEVTSAGNFEFETLATGLSRDEWHRVDVTMNFLDGADNDTVSIELNGAVTSGLKNWENFLGYTSPVGVDSVIFRVASPIDFGTNTGGVAALAGGGVLFDNVSLAAVPEPTTIVLLGVAALTVSSRRRSA